MLRVNLQPEPPAPLARHTARRASRGVTLVEILVGITILGLVAGAIAIAVLPQLGRAKVKTALLDIKTFESGIETYMLDATDCPSTLGDLIATGHLKKHSLKDPWGQDYQYACPGTRNPDVADVWSNGPDKKPSTEDDIWAE